jgi:hypothetical protein
MRVCKVCHVPINGQSNIIAAWNKGQKANLGFTQFALNNFGWSIDLIPECKGWMPPRIFLTENYSISRKIWFSCGRKLTATLFSYAGFTPIFVSVWPSYKFAQANNNYILNKLKTSIKFPLSICKVIAILEPCSAQSAGRFLNSDFFRNKSDWLVLTGTKDAKPEVHRILPLLAKRRNNQIIIYVVCKYLNRNFILY